jgi:hypothetical protein
VHISNIHARDELHRHSKLSSAVRAVNCGLGPAAAIARSRRACWWRRYAYLTPRRSRQRWRTSLTGPRSESISCFAKSLPTAFPALWREKAHGLELEDLGVVDLLGNVSGNAQVFEHLA